MAKKGKSVHPADAHRKALKKREIKKNQQDKKRIKLIQLAQKDYKKIQSEIDALRKIGNKDLDPAQRSQLSSLQAELKKIAEARKELDLSEIPQHSTSTTTTTRPTHQKHPTSRGGPRIRPEQSPYYDPFYNPFGVPPPGAPSLNIIMPGDEDYVEPERDGGSSDGSLDEEEEESEMEVDSESESESGSEDSSEEDEESSADEQPQPQAQPPTTSAEITYRDIRHIPIPIGYPEEKSIYYKDLVQLPETRMPMDILKEMLKMRREVKKPQEEKKKKVETKSPIQQKPIQQQNEQQKQQQKPKTFPPLPPPHTLPFRPGMPLPRPPLPPPPITMAQLSALPRPPLPPPPGFLPTRPQQPRPTPRPKPSPPKPSTTSIQKAQANISVSAAPQIRDLQKELTTLVPVALRKKPMGPVAVAKVDNEGEEKDTETSSTDVKKPETTAAYEAFMKEMEGLL